VTQRSRLILALAGGVGIGLVAFYVVSAGSMYWLNGHDALDYAVGGLVSVIAIGVLVAMSIMHPVIGATGGATVLVVALVSLIAGSRINLGVPSTFTDIPTVFWHGGYSVVVFVTGVTMAVASLTMIWRAPSGGAG
jgi:hypothetical protein